MKIIIRIGEEKDFEGLLILIKELAEFEDGLSFVTNNVNRMKEDKHLFNFFVAEKDGEIIRAAICFFAYFTWVGKSLYLDDLYVKSEYRGKKIGSGLLRKVFEFAKEQNCNRLRWQVINWNKSAIEFYEKCGANISNEWLNCDFSEKDISKFLQNK